MAKVFLGVGHGGSDSGATGNGFKEKDLNLSIGLACRDFLIRHGVEVEMSRTADVTSSIQKRISQCNAYGPDLALDIHNNAGGGDGAEVYHHYAGGRGKTLAENILTEMGSIGQNSRGAKVKKNSAGKDYFGFIRQTAAPAVIVECAFVDNAKDIQIVSTPEKQRDMGFAIACGVLKTLGIPVLQPGDVNGDGKVDAADALLALQDSVNLTQLDGVQRAQADLNGDGRVDAADALKMLQKSVGVE